MTNQEQQIKADQQWEADATVVLAILQRQARRRGECGVNFAFDAVCDRRRGHAGPCMVLGGAQ